MRPAESDDLQHLTPRQETAIELLIAGRSDAAVSKAIGIHRSTIARWRAWHPAFQAELARRRAEVFGAATDRLRSLLSKALDVVELSLDGPNSVASAHAILRTAGLGRAAPPQSENADADTILATLILENFNENRLEYKRLTNPSEPNTEQMKKMMHAAYESVLAKIRYKLNAQETPIAETTEQRRLA